MSEEEKIVIKNFIKSRLAVDDNWWINFLIGVGLAGISCGDYILEKTETE